MKTLVTHINPHLDDIAAIWLFKKFNPEFKEADIDFISASDGNKNLSLRSRTLRSADADLKSADLEDTVYVGVGRGRFDEHKGDLDDAAVSLVWKYLKEKDLPAGRQDLTPKDEVEADALAELVNWIRLDDLGKPVRDMDEFSLPSFIRPKNGSKEASLKAVELGIEILDRILDVLINKHRANKDWGKAIEFESKFGKAYAVESSFVDREFCKKIGADLFLMRDPRNDSVQYFTPRFDIDLEPIYKKVKSKDPEADWFLHQSHHMVICGSGSAPDSKKTKLSFEELIEAAK